MAGSAADYSAVLTVAGLPHLERAAIELAVVLDSDGTPAQASIVRQAYLRLLDDLKAIATRTATEAHAFIVEEELQSRVRPDTQGTSGPRMEDYLGESHPLLAVEGSVGINDETVLDADVPWWWTNEEGYSGHIGREMIGYFFDPGFTNPSAPSPARFREHPLFAVGTSADGGGKGPRGGKGRRMTIRNPIPERRFVQRGVDRAEALWHAKIAQARSRFLREVERANAESRAIVARRTPVGPRPGGRRRP